MNLITFCEVNDQGNVSSRLSAMKGIFTYDAIQWLCWAAFFLSPSFLDARPGLIDGKGLNASNKSAKAFDVKEAANMELTSAEGKAIYVKLISYDISSRSIRFFEKETGQSYLIPLGKLDGPSKEKVIDWVTKEAIFQGVKVSMQRKSSSGRAEHFRIQVYNISAIPVDGLRVSYDVDVERGKQGNLGPSIQWRAGDRGMKKMDLPPGETVTIVTNDFTLESHKYKETVTEQVYNSHTNSYQTEYKTKSRTSHDKLNGVTVSLSYGGIVIKKVTHSNQ